MSQTKCPSCSRTIAFQHGDTNLLVCNCGAAVERKLDGSLAKSLAFVISTEDSVIQPGTTGTWMKQPFKVLGRMRLWLKESTFNYWTILINGTELGYLAEAYGIYAVYRKKKVERKFTSFDLTSWKYGDKRKLDNEDQYLLEREHECYKWELEGETWFPVTDTKLRIFELTSEKYGRVELIETARDEVIAFDVQYTSFTTLSLTNTRSYLYAGLTFECSNCNEPVTVKTFPYAHSCTCGKCGTRYALKNSASFQKEKRKNQAQIGPEIPLGSTGHMNGVQYEVIGFTLKEEDNIYHSRWKEYTLHHPTEGYAFLSEFNGHWIFIKERCDSPVLENFSRATWLERDKERYELYNTYSYSVINAVGEFPNNIFNDESTSVNEYISPPEVWMIENSKIEGLSWFHGEHVSWKKMAASFQFPGGMPLSTGVGAVEPKGFVSPKKLMFTGLLAVAALIFIHSILSYTHKKEILIDEVIYITDSTGRASRVTPRLDFDKWQSNVRFDITARVSNSWFELNATLVNADNGKEYSVEKGVEYYFGYSDGESWTEGSVEESAWLNRIPRGKYFLQIEGIKEPGSLLDTFYLTVTYDVQNQRNFWFCFGFIAVIIIGKFFLVQFNERRRWSNSPYTPYEQGGDDE